MCSQGDDPTTYDAPVPVRPRAYVLSGTAPEPRPSVALAVLGELLNDAERDYERSSHDPEVALQVAAYREARDRVAEAEAKG